MFLSLPTDFHYNANSKFAISDYHNTTTLKLKGVTISPSPSLPPSLSLSLSLSPSLPLSLSPSLPLSPPQKTGHYSDRQVAASKLIFKDCC